jgi:hypothetical protein
MIASNYYSANSKTHFTVTYRTTQNRTFTFVLVRYLQITAPPARYFFYIFIDIKTRGKYSFGVSEANLIVIHVRVVKNTRKRRCKI